MRYIPGFILLAVFGLMCFFGITYDYKSGSAIAPAIHAAAPAVADVVPLASFAGRVVMHCRAKGSSAKLSSVANQTARIAEATFTRREHQEAFLMMVCIESRFDNSSRSKVGAVGYSQLMPALIPQFATDCGLGEMTAQDAQDGEMNLRLGACVFKQLLEKFDGNVALALSGYNSGPDSPTTKKLTRLVPGHPETNGYLASFYVLHEQMK